LAEKQERTVRQMIAEPPALSPLPQTKPQFVENASVPTLLLGHPARVTLASGSGWTVLAAFRRSLYCRTDQGDLICVGLPSLGPGPLNVLAALPPDAVRRAAADIAQTVADAAAQRAATARETGP
jgi:hypothetical protein